ncbi:MAG: malate synthase G [Geminicoccaceae bacterium]
MVERVERYGLQVASELQRFIEEEALPGTGIEAARFWEQASSVIHDLSPRNAALLARRDELQAKIDGWHREHDFELDAYKNFLREIGYLVAEGDAFSVTTANVDPEIAEIAGAQLVVPITNARYALNAANARFGSLYDALYGTDAIAESGGATRGEHYNPLRGEKVIAFARGVLDEAAPLDGASHKDARGYSVRDGKLVVAIAGGECGLADPTQFAGYRGEASNPSAILLAHHGLHLEIVIDSDHPIGRTDPANVADLVVEAAVTTIMDLEDSIAAVDAGDKVLAYRNWLGLMQGTLEAKFAKGGRTLTRRLEEDRIYTAPDGGTVSLKGRSLMLVRNVGHLMTTPAILTHDGKEVPEGILDALVTTLIGMHDFMPGGRGANSAKGSIYIVKPKMHGPEEVAFANELFARVEDALSLQQLHDEDGHHGRGTATVNLGMYPARPAAGLLHQYGLPRARGERDPHRDGSRAHDPKADMKGAAWIRLTARTGMSMSGIECGLPGHAQIGKGMWRCPI